MAELEPVVLTPEGGQPIRVTAFNPSQYSIAKKVNWKDTKSRGLQVAVPHFDGGTRSFSLSLVFDAFEKEGAERDVRRQTKEIAKLAEPRDQKTGPPAVRVTWGADAPADSPYVGLPFRGVVESVTQKFTLFAEDGTPLRATVDVSFKEVKAPTRQQKENPPPNTSPLQPRTRVVREGDSLWSIAAAEYGDPGRWRPIAEANGITDPRVVEPGRNLVIPSIPS
jgi:nucleoid-associated protein YgaU